MSTEPMAEARLAEIREHIAYASETAMTRGDLYARDLLAEIDRLQEKDRSGMAWEARMAGALHTAVGSTHDLVAEINRLRANLRASLHAALSDLDLKSVSLDRLTVNELTDMLALAIEQDGGEGRE